MNIFIFFNTVYMPHCTTNVSSNILGFKNDEQVPKTSDMNFGDPYEGKSTCVQHICGG